MLNIRKGFFETNSSSSHSISISDAKFNKEKRLDSLTVENGVCKIYPGEFGWGPEKFNDSASKASYCLTYVKQYRPELVKMLEDVIKEITKASSVEYIPLLDDCYEWGYIDHQSSDVGDEIFSSKDNLKNFIFNPKSILWIDNDNH